MGARNRGGLTLVHSRRNPGSVASSEAAVFMFGESLRFFWASRRALAHTGYAPAELCGRSPWDLKPDYDEASFRRLIEPLQVGVCEVCFRTTHRRRDGCAILVSVAVRRHQQGDAAPFYVAVVREIDPGVGANDGRAARLRQRMRLGNQVALSNKVTELRRLGKLLADEAGCVRAGETRGVAENLTYFSEWLFDAFGRG